MTMSYLSKAGRSVEGVQTVDALLAQADLNWTVSKAQSHVVLPDGTLAEIPGQHGILREGSRTPFPCSVGNRYVELQNRDLAAFALSLGHASGEQVMVERAGPLYGGRRVVFQCRVGAEMRIRRTGGHTFLTDVQQAYLVLHAPHDGSGSVLATDIIRRLLCTNGATVDDVAHRIHIQHTSSAQDRLRAAVEAIGYTVRRAAEFGQIAQELADTPMDRGEFCTFVSQLLTGKDDAQEAQEIVARSEGRTRTNFDTRGAALVELFEHGIGNAGRDRFDGLNAVTEFIDHQRGRSATWRERATRMQIDQAVDSATFGTGARLKVRALELLRR